MKYFLDGAPCHTTALNLAYLGSRFPEVWTKQPMRHAEVVERAQGTMHIYPVRSPDLSALDNYFWSRLKDRVFSHPRPRNLAELRRKIIRAGEWFNNHHSDEIRRGVLATKTKAQEVIAVGGDYIR